MSGSRVLRWSRRHPTVIAASAAFVATLAGYGIAASDAAADDPPLGPGLVTVEMGIEYSAFSLDDLRVRPGTVVRFVVDNDDPIHHELVVGPEAVHRRHQHGTERAHPPVPGEVSVGPNETAMTFYRFDEPGTIEFACHLPGHVAYGMVGTVTVEE